MAYRFLIWNQANDGLTMAIRAADTQSLDELGGICSEADVAGNWSNLQHYLDSASTAADRPIPFVRLVDIVWLNKRPFGKPKFFEARRFRVTYTGNARAGGGYASQGYCILPPECAAQLLPLHQHAVDVEYIPGIERDCLVVL